MKIIFCIFQFFAVLFLIGVVTSQSMIREKRGIRDAFKKIGDSALPAFGHAAGSALGGRAGNAKFRRG